MHVGDITVKIRKCSGYTSDYFIAKACSLC